MFFSFSSRFFLLCILTLSLFANLVFADTLNKEATFYADSLEGNLTKNGDIFHNNGYSAALCDLPLDTYIYASWGGTGVVVDVNDRPASSTCSQKPDTRDFSKEVFRLFAPPNVGRISNIQVTPLGIAPIDVEKGFFPSDVFAHLGVRLTSQVPTVLFAGEGMTIRGKVMEKSKYAIVSISEIGLDSKESSLVKVEKDGTFQIQILLPKTPGKYAFVIAKGQGFNTEKFATIALVDKNNFFYPSLPTERYKITPRITASPGVPSISLPDNFSADITLRQGDSIFQTSGKSLILSDTGLKTGKASVKLGGYLLSTASPLDRSSRILSAFSGNIILERTREVIGMENLYLNIRKNRATFSFIAPSDVRLRSDYYITDQNGKVIQKFFIPQLVDDKLIIPGSAIRQDFEFKEYGVYKLEILKANGEAFINIPIVYGNNIWPIISLYSNEQIKKINYDLKTVKNDNHRRLNELRAIYGLSLLSLDEELTKIAQAKADDFIIRKYAPAHIDIDGNDIYDFAIARGFKPTLRIGENIASGKISHISLQDGLEESGSHRHSMLDTKFTKIGIGYTINAGKTYLVQVFGN